MAYGLTEEYRKKIEPLLPLAKKAYGPRDQNTPQHEASREYTKLLAEFQALGGSLPELAHALGVAYAGVRRRVVMKDVMVSNLKPRARGKAENMEAAAARVLAAKALGTDKYHDQLAVEYEAGVPLSALARQMGLSSAAPLYYGVQRSMQRREEALV